ncbi:MULTISPECIES: multiple monosaccharide ABC transporter substrate-binding protein [Pseudonocardia]|uniref:Multiple sugar-binding periplasmic receptor ChvE n=2 Tax=Pseudonocardia TaxID=1847 RepID=A0A1Y2MUM1_PSEAH|nr:MULTISPECIES: multiple monosaccharide ABC transporter substrate-binding protein [Pseudonocardia]OSY38882.1 Multiple sugar-binding periplasmic receptor ChvE precursor [Pseudonocardia autotrophica]TDN76138.1 monosaccharide ABC transporter substrate-binding protein (CUT2 family) [Pseudonocardia autotrophica]BBG00119.1 sugar ABC transporter substrate-binding protein [Pseudonocardia autotrophica]GEC26084.1 sugar ABC transporter substrate-binding protein [Pseudonocardia saturnea]
MWKRVRAVAVGALLVVGLAACGGEGASGGGGAGSGAAAEDLLVGVAMPTQTSERWIADGNSVRDQLTEAGYQVDLQFAGDDIPTQSQQIDQMITRGADLLVVAAIDGTALSGQLQAAADAGIPVISYDRLIRDTEHVDFYVTFDNFQVGVAQANALLTGLGLQNEDGTPGPESGPFVVELFAGSLDDNNAFFFYDGAMSVLQPLIDDGTLDVRSNQTTIEQIATLRWAQETAQRRMEDLLTSAYSDGTPVAGVLSPYDGISRGIITALQNAGYGGPDRPLPVVTGQDAEIASVNLVSRGVQNSTIFKDTRELAEQAVVAAKAFLEGGVPEANDTTTYENGVKVVPAFLLPVQTVYQDNITEVLVDSGYYTAEDVERGQQG